MKKSNNYKVAVIDIETTGLNPEIDLILEIGVVELDIRTGEIKILMNSLVKEPKFGEQHRNSWIFGNSDLKFEDIENAPRLDDLRHKLNEIFTQYPITSFNKAFDLGFLRAKGINVLNELPCIMLKTKNILKIPFNGVSYKRPNVQEAWGFFFPYTRYSEKHRAVDDAYHEAKILFELYKQGYFSI